MSFESDTPTHEMPAMREPMTMSTDSGDSMQPVLLALRAVLQEVKTLGRQVDQLTRTVNANVTDNAVIKVRFEAQDGLVKSLTARVESLEKERDDLTQSILAKAVTLVLVLSGGIAAALWVITHKASP